MEIPLIPPANPTSSIPYNAGSRVAEVNTWTLRPDLGHASNIVTIDRHGHVYPRNESDAAALLDAHLDQNG
jgi:hypothetical protein